MAISIPVVHIIFHFYSTVQPFLQWIAFLQRHCRLREKQYFWSDISLFTMYFCSAYCQCFLVFSQDDLEKNKRKVMLLMNVCLVEVGTVCSWACVWLQGLRLQRGRSATLFWHSSKQVVHTLGRFDEDHASSDSPTDSCAMPCYSSSSF